MQTIRCVYCDWVGYEPSPAEFETDESFRLAMEEFERDRDQNCCVKPFIVYNDTAICRFCGTLLSKNINNVPTCTCR